MLTVQEYKWTSTNISTGLHHTIWHNKFFKSFPKSHRTTVRSPLLRITEKPPLRSFRKSSEYTRNTFTNICKMPSYGVIWKDAETGALGNRFVRIDGELFLSRQHDRTWDYVFPDSTNSLFAVCPRISADDDFDISPFCICFCWYRALSFFNFFSLVGVYRLTFFQSLEFHFKGCMP